MRYFKRLAALGMSAVMVAGSVMPVMAADDTRKTEIVDTQGTGSDDGTTMTPTAYTVNGTGSIEKVLSDTVFKISVPTSTALAQIFSFTVDPQQLVYKTNGGQYQVPDEEGNPTIDIEEGATVLFKNVETTPADEEAGTAESYKLTGVSSMSDELVITNMSSKPLNIDVECSLVMSTPETGQDSYAGGYSTNREFSNVDDIVNREAGLYIGMIATGQVEQDLFVPETPETGDPVPAVSYTNVALGAADAYVYSYDTDYKYSIPADMEFEYPTYSFRFTGATNPAVDITTWASKSYDKDSGQIILNAYAMPYINLVFTPTVVDATRVQAEFVSEEDEDGVVTRTLQIHNEEVKEFVVGQNDDNEDIIGIDGGILGDTVVSVRVNGKELYADEDGEPNGELSLANTDGTLIGTVVVPESDILAAYTAAGLTVTEKDEEGNDVVSFAEEASVNVVVITVQKAVEDGDPIEVQYYAEF